MGILETGRCMYTSHPEDGIVDKITATKSGIMLQFKGEIRKTKRRGKA